MKPIKQFSYLLVLSFAALIFSNCGGTDNPIWTDDGTTNDSTQTGISLDKLNYNGFEAVLIKSEGLFTDQVYIAYLDTLSIELNYISESALGFTVPNLESDNYALRIDGFEEQFTLSITQTAEVASPEQSVIGFIGDYKTEIDEIINYTKHLDSLGLVQNATADIAELENAKDSLADAIQMISQLSTEDQQKLAQYVAANSENLNELNRILDGVYEDGSFKKGNCDYIEDWGKATCLIREMMRGVVLMGAPAAIGGVLGAELSAGLGTVVGAVVFTKIFKSKVIAGRNRFKNAFIELANWAFIPADNIMAEVTANKKTLEFENNVAKEIEFSFETRTINEAKDKNHEDLGIMFTLLQAFNYINEKVLKRPTFTLPGEKKGSYSPKDLSTIEFELIGNDNVDGELFIEGAGLKLKLFHNKISNQNVRLRMYLVYANQTITSPEIDVVVISPPPCPETIEDIDGNVYKVVYIGGNCWTAENIIVTKLNDGTSINEVTGDDNKSGDSYTYYGYDKSKVADYGLLYMFSIINSGKICPKGWEVPTMSNWNSLGLFGVPSSFQLQFGGKAHPDLPSTPTSKNRFEGIDEKGVYWVNDNYLLWTMPIVQFDTNFDMDNKSKLHQYGYASCRCIKSK